MRSSVRLITSALVLVSAVGNPVVLFSAQQGAGQVDEARRLLVEASHLVKDLPEDQQPSAVANIAGQLTRAADLPDALATIRLLKKKDDQARATGSISWQLAHAGNSIQALALVDSIDDVQIKDANYETLAVLLAQQGELARALQIAHRRKDSFGVAYTLVLIANQRARVKDLSGAREALSEAIDISNQGVEEDPARVTFLTQIAATQAKIGDLGAAFRTVDQFSAIAHQYKGPQGKGLLLQSLASTQAQIGDVVGAQRTVAEIPSGDNSDLALMAISEEQAKHGLMKDALETAGLVSNRAFKSSTLRQIVIARGTHGTLHDAHEAIDLMSEPAERAETIATLALEQAVNENTSASATLQSASELTTATASHASGRTLEFIAVTQAVLGDFAGAQQIVQNMAEPKSRVWPLWNITSLLAEAGRTEEALALAESQDSTYPKAYSLLGTAQGILIRVEAEREAARKQ
jgi:tetratricopeptide (TPR) repeat protein